MPAAVPPRAVRPLVRPPDAVVTVPGSKSITNRALVVAALAAGRSRLTGVLVSDDTEAMAGALTSMGSRLALDPSTLTIEVEGWDGRVPPGPMRIDVRQAGTAARFLPAVCALGTGRYLVDGDAQMRARPMAGLVEGLRALGVEVASSPGGGLPLEVTGQGGKGVAGGRLAVDASVSSQFLSGLLLSSPYFTAGIALEATGRVVSRPYLELTAATMAAFGVGVDIGTGGDRFTVAAGQRYSATQLAVEPDASAASYFFAAAAVTGGRARVEGLGTASRQGDLRFVDVLAAMGATVERGPSYTEVRGGPLRGVDVDMADLSDTVPTLAVTAAFASSPTRIRGVGFIRAKESDRLAAVAAELRRCGVRAEELDDGLVVHPGPPRAAEVHTYDDHRMAMAFAVAGLAVDGISIAGPGCVAKTFPGFFEALDQLR
ncbi:MAG: 3-phosphoshikimate 1-carboxyvinyltransferase [Actinomycetota bacterium]